MKARLSKIIFIELLRREMLKAGSDTTGWLRAIANPTLRKNLNHLHRHPTHDWTQHSLAEATGVSKTILCAQFYVLLGMSQMRYLREWRLYLASARLSETQDPIALVADGAGYGYGYEAAFSRAFTRCFHAPPARWRKINQAPV